MNLVNAKICKIKHLYSYLKTSNRKQEKTIRLLEKNNYRENSSDDAKDPSIIEMFLLLKKIVEKYNGYE
jgi:hypothetical protein